MFKNNVGGVDTAIRAVLGSLFIVLGAVVADQRPFLALGAGLVGLAVLVTAIAGTCFLYTDLGLASLGGLALARPPQASAQSGTAAWRPQTVPLWGVSYSPDIGLLVGAGIKHTRYGFRELPPSTRLLAEGACATGVRACRLDAAGEFRRPLSPSILFVELRVSGLELTRFYGTGNETAGSRPDSVYRVRQTQLLPGPRVAIPLAPPPPLRPAGCTCPGRAAGPALLGPSPTPSRAGRRRRRPTSRPGTRRRRRSRSAPAAPRRAAPSRSRSWCTWGVKRRSGATPGSVSRDGEAPMGTSSCGCPPAACRSPTSASSGWRTRGGCGPRGSRQTVGTPRGEAGCGSPGSIAGPRLCRSRSPGAPSARRSTSARGSCFEG